jgi:hypothetical protein
MSSPEWNPIPLRFETIEKAPGLPPSYSLTVLDVERDIYGIRINYEIVPPLPRGPLAPRPYGEARDDRGGEYDDVGGAFGLAEPGDRTDGVLTMPLPSEDASLLDVRMSWSPEDASLWERPALAIRISL